MRKSRFIPIVVASAHLILCGCRATMKERELEKVAKDWCMTIRASQVVPVYPLTEDLQPGDVFLVQVPIQKQERLYEDRGFLPLDQLIVRLKALNYGDFYFDSYFKPYYHGQALDRPEADPNSKEQRFKKAPLPMAVFPSYTFDVDTSSGLRIALPVKGIPVGMGLMNAASAAGSITISDGMTYAIGTQEVLRRLDDWVVDPNVHRLLREVQLTTKGEVYLRVVTRVYMVGAVDISLIRKRVGGAGLEAGQAPAIKLVNLLVKDANDAEVKDANDAKTGVQAYQTILDELSKPMAGAVPGGALRVAWASGNKVILKEKFPRLLAIGYLGFDVPILKDGSLGPPIATRDHIDPEVALRPAPIPATGPVAWNTIFNLYRMLTPKGVYVSKEAEQVANSMNLLFYKFKLPKDMTFFKEDLDEETDKSFITKRADRGGYDKADLSGFRRLNALYGIMNDSIGTLETAIDGGLVKQNGEELSSDERRQYAAELERQRKLQESLVRLVRQDRAVRNALELSFGDILHSRKEK